MAGIIIFLVVIGKITEVIRVLEKMAAQANLNMVYLDTILKIIGIAYIAEFGAQITRDAGQGAIASRNRISRESVNHGYGHPDSLFNCGNDYPVTPY